LRGRIKPRHAHVLSKIESNLG